jgi:microcystin degradation protein MlrC
MAYKVLAAQIMHETNTFSKLPTDEEAYRRRYLYFGEDVTPAMRGTKTELGGIVDAADAYDWRLTTPVAANATPSGKVTAACWEKLLGAVLAAIDTDGPFDGMVLALHGAMVAETADDAEGELLRRIRAKVGTKIPIAITLDLHANATEAMAEHASAIVAFRTYPHIDQYERGRQASDLVQRAMKGEIRPVTSFARRPMIMGFNAGITQHGPMRDALDRAAAIERRGEALVVSLHTGFGWADIADTGPSATVTTDGDKAKGRRLAEEFMEDCWRTRDVTPWPFPTVAEAIAQLRSLGPGDKPVILADATDNPGGGAYGDATNLLRGLIEGGIDGVALATITDPEAVEIGRKAGHGAAVTLSLGGKIDPRYGAPIHVMGTVENLSDGTMINDGPMYAGVKLSMGPTMVLRVGGIQIVVASNRLQTTDRQAFLSQGIDPTRCKVLVVKSTHHFRAAFEPMARQTNTVDSGALCSPDFRIFPFKKLRRPIYPLDPI